MRWDEAKMKGRVWLRAHFSWSITGSNLDRRIRVEIAPQGWLTRKYWKQIQKAEVQAYLQFLEDSGIHPSYTLDPVDGWGGADERTNRGEPWWEALPKTGRVLSPKIDHELVQRQKRTMRTAADLERGRTVAHLNSYNNARSWRV